MRSHTTMATLTLAALAAAASADVVLLQSFQLNDHPAGHVNPQDYGLRIDGFSGESPATFSFEDGSGDSQVQLHVYDNNGQTEIRIRGYVTGNSADGGTDFGTFFIDFVYNVDVEANGWDDNQTTDGGLVGSLTAVSPTVDSDLAMGESMDLFSISDGSGSFRFLQDGWRVDGDDSSWVGRGWLSDDGNYDTISDFLFSGTAIVPLPPAAFAGLGMLAGLGVYRRIRR